MSETNYSSYIETNSPLIKAKKIAVVVLDGLGDSILSLPAIRFLIKACPQSKILVIASSLGAPVFAGTAQTIVFNPKEPDFKAKLTAALQNGHFDAVLCFTEKGYALSAVYQSGIPVRCGFFPGWSQPLKSLALLWQINYRAYYYNDPRIDQKIHQTARLFLLLKKLGLKTPAEENFPDLTLELSAEQLAQGRQALAQALGLPESELSKHKICAIQLLPRWSKAIMNWAQSGYANKKLTDSSSVSEIQTNQSSVYWRLLKPIALLYKKLLQGKYIPIFSCAPADRIWADVFIEDLSNDIKRDDTFTVADKKAANQIPIFSQPDLYAFAAFLKGCNFLVTPIGGSAHLAAAIKLPEVVFFPPENLKHELTRWKPWRTTCEVVVKQDKNQDDETLSQNLYEACKKICP
ncbi:MAG: glycosyltransferase family 9 protein [Candidatus Bruticola sp.]